MQAYIIQVILFQLLFLVVYEALLKKETFFSYNRGYLLLTPILAFLIPLLKIEFLGSVIPEETLGLMLPEVVLGNAISQPIDSASVELNNAVISINWWALIYFSGVIVSLFIFIKKYVSLSRMFKFQQVREEKEFRIIEIPDSTIACTFFKTIFLGASLSAEEKQAIISHELIHVKQRHSVDLLFFELLRIILWFNPLVYIYQSHITGVHEFLADKEVVKHTEKKQYYQQLLNTAFNTQNISFINQFFNHSLIKKRIVMLQKSQSKTIAKFKYLIILPLILLMLTYVSCGVKNVANNEPVTETTSEPNQAPVVAQTVEDWTGDPLENVPFAVVEQIPIFPGCENLDTNDLQKQCMSEKIAQFVNLNFDTSLGKKLKMYGVNRVIVQFKINKEGDISNVRARAPHPELETEAIRVINSLPKMIPGKQKGKEVGVMYSLPIVFQVQKTEEVDEKN